ncbi:STAS domain-containing protein [Micromonospora globbae]|jgi:anti-anti-sigma factor|uniref:Anti-sigma factor antagonist n=1 Tax=Micromonospora globbae TaxID=1894969 RepID=A0A420EXQ5_9ACTN|nr:STAS domain-containing protein [Micromonospora globbae]RKF25499.1 anti-sigma factor antagonist [Micromonospora globbae]
MNLTITTSGECPLVRLSLTGRLGTPTSGLVYDAVLAALRADTVRHVDLDLANVTRFDPAATSTLVACHRAVHVRGGILRLVNIPPTVRRQLFTAGLLGLLDGDKSPVQAPAQPA